MTARPSRPGLTAPLRPRPWVTVEEALTALAAGRFVIVVDSDDSQATGDVLFAASHVNAERVNFLIRETRGVIYLGLTDQRCRELELARMVDGHQPDSWQSAFTVSIEARHGVTTGISAADRARTIAVAISPESTAADIRRPGHIFPLRAVPTGTLGRQGRTEAYVDLPRLAGLYPAGIAASVINADGTLARLPDLLDFAGHHDMGVLTVADVRAHRLRCDDLVTGSGQAAFYSGEVLATSTRYRDVVHGRQYVAVSFPSHGDDLPAPVVALVTSCLEGHVLGSLTCDCRASLDEDLRRLRAAGGVLLVREDEQVCPRTPSISGDSYEQAVLAAVVSTLGLPRVRVLPSADELRDAVAARGIDVVDAFTGTEHPAFSASPIPPRTV